MNVHDRKITSMTRAETTNRRESPSGSPHSDAPQAISTASVPSGEGQQQRSRSSILPVLATAARITLKTLLPLAVIAAGYFAFKYLTGTKPEAPVRPKQERSFAITSVEARAGDFQPSLALFGTTVAGREVDIRALVSGQIIKTGETLREGGQIDAGELLLKIDPIDYRTGLAELEAQLLETRAKISEFESELAAGKQSLKHAREQVELALTDLSRATPLVKRGTVSARTVDDRRQIVLQRQQAADQIENNLPVWEARIAQQIAAVSRIDTAIERAQRRLTETELRAPFSAFVTEVGAQVGRLVSSNDKVATLIDRNWIEVRFNLTDEQFGRIVAKEGPLDGRQVEVRWVLGNNTFTYTATIERIGARISSATGGVEVYARIKDPSQPVPLHPGAFVEIDVPDTKFNSAFRLPSTALYSGNTVYVIEKERLIPRKVRVIGGIENDILIEGEISDGDRVMITRISTPGEGVKVTEAKSQ